MLRLDRLDDEEGEIAPLSSLRDVSKTWTPNPGEHNQAFVATLNDQTVNDTAIIFKNTDHPDAEHWENLSLRSRLFEPQVILSLFYSHWEFFRALIDDIIDIDHDTEKTKTIINLLTKDTGYSPRGEASNRENLKHNPFSIKLFAVQVKGTSLQFHLGVYPCEMQPNFTISYKTLAECFIKSQYEVKTDFKIAGRPDGTSASLKMQSWLKKDSRNIRFQEEDEACSLSGLLKHLPQSECPSLYADFWMAIAKDIEAPDILRVKILLDFYDRILSKEQLSEDTRRMLETALERPRILLASAMPSTYPCVPDEIFQDMLRQVIPKAYTDHMSEQSKTGTGAMELIANAGKHVVSSMTRGKIARDYLQVIADQLLTKEEGALQLYVILKSLFYVVHAHIPEATSETPILHDYANCIHAALTDYERHVERKHLPEGSYPVTSAKCELTPEAASDALKLKHSPYAWDELLNQYKYQVAFLNFTLGFGFDKKHGFKVVGLELSGGAYLITYLLPDQRRQLFKLATTEALKNYLKNKTKDSFNIPLSKRIETENVLENQRKATLANKSMAGMEDEVKKQKELQLNALNWLFSEEQQSHWGEQPQMKSLYGCLRAQIIEQKAILTLDEKIALLVYSLITAVIQDDKMLVPVADIFVLMLGGGAPYLLCNKSELLIHIKNYAHDEGVSITDFCWRKARLCSVLAERLGLPDSFEFKSYESLQEMFSNAEARKAATHTPDTGTIKQLNQKAFILSKFKCEYEQYEKGENKLALFTIFFYLSLVESADERLLVLFKDLGYGLSKKQPEKWPALWATGILCHAISKASLYDAIKLGRDANRLSLLTLAENWVQSQEATLKEINTGKFYNGSLMVSETARLSSMLEEHELASIKNDIIPEFFKEQEERQTEEKLEDEGRASSSKRTHQSTSKSKSKRKIPQLPLKKFDPEHDGSKLKDSKDPMGGIIARTVQLVSSGVNAIVPSTSSQTEVLNSQTNEGVEDQMQNAANLFQTIIGGDTNTQNQVSPPPAPNFQKDNEEYIKLFLAPLTPELDDWYTKVIQKYSDASYKIKQLYAQYPTLQESLENPLKNLDDIEKSAIDEKSAIAALRIEQTSRLQTYFDKERSNNHRNQLKQDPQVIAAVVALNKITVAYLETLLNHLNAAADQLNKRYKSVADSLAESEKSKVASKKLAEERAKTYLENNADKLKRILEDVEYSLKSEISAFQPNTRALIYAKDGVKTTKTLSDKGMQYAKALESISKLNSNLNVIQRKTEALEENSGSSISVPSVRPYSYKPIDIQYIDLKGQLMADNQRYEGLNWVFNFSQKWALRNSIKETEKKLSLYELKTKDEREYEELSAWNPMNWSRLWTLRNTIKESTKKTISSHGLPDIFAYALVNVKETSAINFDQEQLIFMGEKLREKAAHEYEESLSKKSPNEVFAQCAANIESLQEAIKFKGEHSDNIKALNATLKGFEESKVWSDPVDAVLGKVPSMIFQEAGAESDVFAKAQKDAVRFSNYAMKNAQKVNDARGFIYDNPFLPRESTASSSQSSSSSHSASV